MNFFHITQGKILKDKEAFFSVLSKNKGCTAVTFMNPYNSLYAKKNPYIYKDFDYLGVDGIFMAKTLSLLMGLNIPRLSFDMTSLAPIVFESAKGKGIYFIGTTEDLIHKSIDNLKKKFPELIVLGYRNGYFKDEVERLEVIKKIISLRPEIVIVGMGHPYQDIFSIELKRAGYTGVVFTCGGFLHQSAECILYYPKWIDRFNLRWLYRFINEPRIIKRVLIYYPVFLISLLLDWINIKRRYPEKAL